MLQKGFTLIELLVVIAIIGILATVVIGSVSSARAKGANAAVKSNLSNSRAVAEIFYDSNNTYAGVCTAPASGGTQTANSSALAAIKITSTSPSVTSQNSGTATPTASTAVCVESADGYVVAAPLKSPTGAMYCVDSNGAKKEYASGIFTTTIAAAAPLGPRCP